MSDAGKGDDVRPRFISKEEWDTNYERTFGKPKNNKKISEEEQKEIELEEIENVSRETEGND